MPADAPLAFTAAQLAKHWSVSARTVYKMVETGELGHIRVRSLIRIRQADVDAYEARTWRPPRDMTAATAVASATFKRDAFAMGQAAASRREELK